MKCLIVDDSPAMRRVVANSVKRFADFEISEATNGLEALDFLKTTKVDLILLDWLMPELDGINFMRVIRSKDRWKDIPVLMITTKSSKEDIIEAIKAGVNDYIVKPVVPIVLEEKINEILSRNSG
jgi:two-component system, chemotaxis family, chemotaxis protein CheY